MKTLLISACLLGVRCRYDGGSKPQPGVEALAEQYRLIPVCPEQLGGLCTPRTPAERQGDRVCTRNGGDVTEAYRRGAEEALRLAKLYGAKYAVLKERSPSCGKGVIYDGSFSGVLTEGDGVFAQKLRERGVPVYGESDIPRLLEEAGTAAFPSASPLLFAAEAAALREGLRARKWRR